jgi:hypothetical protein
MTDEDKRQQKAMLLLEFQEAEEELAHLEENAKRLAGDIREVADWVETATFPDFLRKREIQERHAKLSSEAGSKRYSEALDFEKARDSVSLVTEAREKVEELKQRKASLGLK